MTPKPSLSRIAVATAAALGASLSSHAVNLNPNGLGQALIYPYYTVRADPGGNAFNTYLSVVNAATQAKAVRVRLREGRAAKPVLDFNLFLGPNDVWTGALVPTVDGTRLLTTDTSCTDPALGADSGSSSTVLGAHAYLNDGYGDALDRTREGFVEVIEMAALAGASAAAVTHNATGMPVNCAAVRGSTNLDTAAPSGGLSGTLTLINVNSGLDFTHPATALADLSTRTLLYPAGDPNPSLASSEIDPVSVVIANGHVYRSVWTRAQDAVSAVLMHTGWTGEFVLDNATRSLTDFVATLPTRHFYVTPSTAEPPFTVPARPQRGEGEPLRIAFFNREEQGAVVTYADFLLPPNVPGPSLYASAAVAPIRNAAIHMPTDTTRTAVLGSTTFGMGPIVNVNGSFQNGWLDFQVASPEAANALRSLPGSTRTSVATGEATTGPHAYFGLPLLGFTVRTFSNGTLACSGAGSCQGNYGGAFTLKYRRRITTP
jgi:hypothetical protein